MASINVLCLVCCNHTAVTAIVVYQFLHDWPALLDRHYGDTFVIIVVQSYSLNSIKSHHVQLDVVALLELLLLANNRRIVYSGP